MKQKNLNEIHTNNEFNVISDENGRITEADFAELLLAYAGYPAKKKARMLKRVKKTWVPILRDPC